MNDELVLQPGRIHADQLMLKALLAHLAIVLAVAAFTDTWGVALAVGLPALLVPFAIYRMAPGALPTRLAMAAAFMIFSALLIQQTRGQIEAHFGIFVLLAFLLYYRDWRPIVVAAGVIAVHHLAFNYLQAAGMGFYVLIGGPNLPLILIHAAYVIAEAGVLIYMAHSLRLQALESAHVARLAERIGAGDLVLDDTRATPAMPLLGQVVTMREQLAETLTVMRDGAHRVSDMASDLNAQASQVDRAMTEQSEATGRIAATIEQITHSIRELSTSAEDARRLANQSGEASRQGAGVVETTIREIEKIAAAIGTLSGDMERLGGQFESVANVVGLIKEIADQTNLLALNAAIEAARAGEQGRGFAVVADEVRKLAERTTQATEDISRTIQEIRASKDSALSGIGAAVDQAAEGVRLASSAGRAIDAIGQEVRAVHGVIGGIAGGLGEQSRATQNIARDIDRISAMARDSREAAEVTRRGTGEMASLADRVVASAEKFKLR